MADNTPWIREPSVKTVVKDNGNRTALEQWALLTLIPSLVLIGLYLAVRSQMTVDTWHTLFTLIGMAAAIGALVRWGRWHNVELDPAKTRRPDAARVGLNLIANSWPIGLLIAWQVMVVEPLARTLAEGWQIVILFIFCACAVFATVFFGKRLIRELRDPLAGNSIEIGVRERELEHELKLEQLKAIKAQGDAQYAQQLDDQVRQLQVELAKARRSSRVIFANHGTARGDSSLVIDDNERMNEFVVRAFGGEDHTRDEWCAILDPGAKTSTVGRQRYDSYRVILANAGLWNQDIRKGPIKSLEEACEALSIPLPRSKNAPAGGRAGGGSALATAPDWESGAGGS